MVAASREYYYRVTSVATDNVWLFDYEPEALAFIHRQPANYEYWLDQMWQRPQVRRSTKIIAKGGDNPA